MNEAKGRRADSPVWSISEAPAFRARLGNTTARPAPKAKLFVGRIKALVRAQRVAGRSKRSGFGRGGTAAARLPVRGSPQRVTIKSRIVKHSNYGSAQGVARALRRHADYLARDGASRDGDRGIAFDEAGDLTHEDLLRLQRDAIPDRHHFRLIVSPENGEQLDLKSYARELVQEMEKDLSTHLKWFGLAHFDTDNAHVHLFVRGRDDLGEDLVISRDYMSHGMRLQAAEIATQRLGPRRAEDIARSLQRDLTAERVTSLDRRIDAQRQLHPQGLVSALRDASGSASSEQERIRLLARLQNLESLGLAQEVSAGVWLPDPELLPRLKAMSIRGDVIKTLHAAMPDKTWSQDPVILDRKRPLEAPIVGRVVARGRVDELLDEEYLLVGGDTGRELYVPLNGRDALRLNASVGTIVRLEADENPEHSTPGLKVTRLAVDLTSSVTVQGVTFLDRELVREGEGGRVRTQAPGFARELTQALDQRTNYLENLGLVDRKDGQRRGQAGLLDELYAREIAAADGRLRAQYGELQRLEEGVSFCGKIAGVEQLPSGPHTLVAGAGRYALVPESTPLSHIPGRTITLTIGQATALPTLKPRALSLKIETQLVARSRGIGRFL